MQNILDTLWQATLLWNGLFTNNASTSTAPSLNITSFGSLGNTGPSNPILQHSSGGKAICLTGTLAVPVTSSQATILYPGPRDNYELTEFLTDLFSINSNAFIRYIGPSSTVSDTFSIYVKLCVPADEEKTRGLSSVQFLTHGGIGDSSYWDFAEGYSYADAAAEQGYATFSYDRLGSGKSDKPDPVQVVQAPLQVEIAHLLVGMLRDGNIGNMAFTKVVGVGHSLGSAVTQSESARYPDDFDAVVLTGHSGHRGGAGIALSSTARQIANTMEGRPEWKDLPNGYFTLGPAPQTLQFAFFFYPHFDPEIFLKEFKTYGTSTIGETLTLGSIYTPAPGFKKPVLVLNGQQDLFYCQGDCLRDGDVTAQALAVFYPNAPSDQSQAVTLPDMAHQINMHLGRLQAFEKMLDFVSRVGIKP